MGGKTIVGALVFGLVSVELMKRYIGVHQSTGDLYSIPLAVGIAIGRIGCFPPGSPTTTTALPPCSPGPSILATESRATLPNSTKSLSS
jgi:hypothetical protein